MDYNDLDQTVLDILKNAKMRATLPRIQVLKVLIEANKELTAYEIEKEIGQNKRKNLYIASIYAALRAFEQANIVQRFKIGDQQAYYSIKKQKGSIRLYCEECEKTFLIEDDMIEKSISDLSINKNFALKSFSLFIQAKCEECMDKK